MGRGKWPEFCNWAASADDNDVLTCLHAVEQSAGIVGEFLKGDVLHTTIISAFDFSGKRQNKALRPTREIAPAGEAWWQA